MSEPEPTGPREATHIGGIWVSRAPHRNWSFEMSIWTEELRGSGRWAAQAIDWVWVDHRSLSSPVLTFDALGAQDLLDMLWGAGLRPSRGKAPDREHLADMRRIAAAALVKTGVEVVLP